MTIASQPHHSQDRGSVSTLLAPLWRRTKDDRYHTMSERTYAYFMALIGVVCGWVVIRWSFSPASLTLRNALVQGFFVGFGLALVTIEIVARVKAMRINGWITIF